MDSSLHNRINDYCEIAIIFSPRSARRPFLRTLLFYRIGPPISGSDRLLELLIRFNSIFTSVFPRILDAPALLADELALDLQSGIISSQWNTVNEICEFRFAPVFV
jgi:hypothetical protein